MINLLNDVLNEWTRADFKNSLNIEHFTTSALIRHQCQKQG